MSSRLAAISEFQHTHTLLAFVSFGSEVDTVPIIGHLLAAGKRVAVPKVEPTKRALLLREIFDLQTDLAPGYYGIREPVESCSIMPAEELEMALVPAVVWGEDGYRIGYGGGYYDRLLATIPHAARIGLGFELQVVAVVPHGPHDLPVDMLVTEERVRRFAHRRGEN